MKQVFLCGVSKKVLLIIIYTEYISLESSSLIQLIYRCCRELPFFFLEPIT